MSNIKYPAVMYTRFRKHLFRTDFEIVIIMTKRHDNIIVCFTRHMQCSIIDKCIYQW